MKYISLLIAVACCLLRVTWSAPMSVQPNPADTATFFTGVSAPGREIDAKHAAFLNHKFGDSTCPKHLPNTGDLEQRSTCPWYYVINRDENRFPTDIPEARCRCERCMSVHSINQCERVFYHMRVLRREGKKDGKYNWVPAWEKIATGCTCAVPVKHVAADIEPPFFE